MIKIMFDALTKNLPGKRRALDVGATLFHQGDTVRAMFVVEDGLVELIRRQTNGSAIVLHRAGPGAVLAEASAYSATYHCDAVADQPLRVVEFAKAAFLDLLARQPALSAQWAARLAREVQSARYRSEVLTRKTVADRLDGWLAWPGNALPSKGEWKAVAAQIGVSPEALYRELAARRKPR